MCGIYAKVNKNTFYPCQLINISIPNFVILIKIKLKNINLISDEINEYEN